ncbi:hypothetical protein H696_00567 [Fonticula alba]|uniref:USP domain-containing protein n=1 Tax=Fonticula alba TaxID=691883 RepID=A0A058ZHP8_FONAL|nr:hypothetical protein H696_00567 [Fonticula alba]KCV73017.1 hypothetical protein H696_00567 [Fonticula alba]|eukprot:XP_009492718.1 hypothetical protein H696_00567 [Fonticula alba]
MSHQPLAWSNHMGGPPPPGADSAGFVSTHYGGQPPGPPSHHASPYQHTPQAFYHPSPSGSDSGSSSSSSSSLAPGYSVQHSPAPQWAQPIAPYVGHIPPAGQPAQAPSTYGPPPTGHESRQYGGAPGAADPSGPHSQAPHYPHYSQQYQPPPPHVPAYQVPPSQASPSTSPSGSSVSLSRGGFSGPGTPGHPQQHPPSHQQHPPSHQQHHLPPSGPSPAGTPRVQSPSMGAGSSRAPVPARQPTILPLAEFLWVPDRGLLNHSQENNCFFNVVMQMLLHSPVFLAFFFATPKHSPFDCPGVCEAAARRPYREDPPGFCFFCALFDFVHAFLDPEAQSPACPGPIRTFFDSPATGARAKRATIFEAGKQHDPAEILEAIFRELHWCAQAWAVRRKMGESGHSGPPSHLPTSGGADGDAGAPGLGPMSHPTDSGRQLDLSIKGLCTQTACLPDHPPGNTFSLLPSSPGLASASGSEDHLIPRFMNMVPKFFNTGDMFHDSSSHDYVLVGIICLYRNHYTSFHFSRAVNRWRHFDDGAIATLDSSFQSVSDRIQGGCHLPRMLVYERGTCA